MIEADCAACRTLLQGTATKSQHASDIEIAYPGCACENHSVGPGSPGTVADGETLYRFFVAPADVDPVTGEVSARAFHRAFQNGMSVVRSIATTEEAEALAVDVLSNPRGNEPRQILALFAVECSEIRSRQDAPQGRLFCVYDETVPRKNDAALPRVGTHASIYQRPPSPPGTKDRNRVMQDQNAVLARHMKARRIELADFMDGMLVDLNARAARGEFQYDGLPGTS